MKIKSNITKPPFNPIRLSIEIESLEELVSLYVRLITSGPRLKNNYIERRGTYHKEIKDLNFSELGELFEELSSCIERYFPK